MSSQYLVIHMSDPDGLDLDRGEDRRMLEEWSSEGDAGGRIHGGAPVGRPESATSVTVRDGEVIVTDGPFPEFKEWFAGYDLIEADSMEEATAFMAKHPGAILGRLYILPAVKLPWEDE